jgi:hypothetical protein
MYVIMQVYEEEEKDTFDWWSKYYASRPDTHDKSTDYPENFDKVKVSKSAVFRSRSWLRFLHPPSSNTCPLG